MSDRLAPILARKARENLRRASHRGLFDPAGANWPPVDPERAVAALERRGAPLPRIIAEVKFSSPSEGEIRPRTPGAAVRIAHAYATAGAAAISVLCDREGFGGGVADLRRVARAVDRPVLFKEFVLEEIQLDLARAAGATYALLLVRALSPERLARLVGACRERGLVAVVEAADADEVERALRLDAPVIGVNARDLSTFGVDPARAREAIERIPADRVAVYMSGITSHAALVEVAKGRADAVLLGSAAMRADEPGLFVRSLLDSRPRQ